METTRRPRFNMVEYANGLLGSLLTAESEREAPRTGLRDKEEAQGYDSVEPVPSGVTAGKGGVERTGEPEDQTERFTKGERARGLPPELPSIEDINMMVRRAGEFIGCDPELRAFFCIGVAINHGEAMRRQAHHIRQIWQKSDAGLQAAGKYLAELTGKCPAEAANWDCSDYLSEHDGDSRYVRGCDGDGEHGDCWQEYFVRRGDGRA